MILQIGLKLPLTNSEEMSKSPGTGKLDPNGRDMMFLEDRKK